MERKDFERLVEDAFEDLPDQFKDAIENVGVVVEDYPSDELAKSMGLRSRHDLLGLYQGIPLTKRGTWYGMYPAAPDKISLYQKNIEAVAGSDSQLRKKVREVLIHEVGHYFGMTDEEIRKAGF
ncbi:MAG TPA: metallopeptidase family protein [Bacteroidota bacterium]|nr:metallopeptidase family protein [Bacteroidota bacterium]